MEKANELILTIGLPYSGKSVWARNQSSPIVSPDAIRFALHGQRFVQAAEDMVWAMTKLMVRSLFGAGHTSVILDACNNTVKRRDFWQSPEWIRRYLVCDVNPEACRERAKNMGDFEIAPIIDRMSGAQEFNGVFYGQTADQLMIDQIRLPDPGQGDLQLFHQGTANDPWPS